MDAEGILPGETSWTSEDKCRLHMESKKTKTQAQTSLVVPWIRILLPMQGIQVQSQIWEDQPTTGQRSPHATALEPALESLCSSTREATAAKPARLSQRGALTCHGWRKPLCSTEDPAGQKRDYGFLSHHGFLKKQNKQMKNSSSYTQRTAG